MNNEQNIERIRIYIPQIFVQQDMKYKTLCIPVDETISLYEESTSMGYTYTQLRRGGGKRNKDSRPVWAERISVTEYGTEYHELCSLEEARELLHSRGDDINEWPKGTFDFLLDSKKQSLFDIMLEEHIYENISSDRKRELLDEDMKTKADAIKRGVSKEKREKNRKIREEKARKEKEAHEEMIRKEKQEEERLKRISQASPEELAKYGLNAKGEPYFS